MAIELRMYDDIRIWYKHNGIYNNVISADIDPFGMENWYISTCCHNKFGPAVIWESGHTHWFINSIEYSYLEYLVKIQQRNNSKEINNI